MDMQAYELCCDMIDVVIDVSCIYGLVPSCVWGMVYGLQTTWSSNDTSPLLSILWAACISYVVPYNCDNVSMNVFPIPDIVEFCSLMCPFTHDPYSVHVIHPYFIHKRPAFCN